MNRLTANYKQYVPVQLFNSQKPQVFAFNVQAGTVLGDLPPYETFNLGGSNSVRGYDGGDVGSGRSYVLASAEYRFSVLPIVGGVLFADFASDLGSGDTVLGDPAGVRGKPGAGFGYGAGVRVDSPLGLIRADYGISDQGESRVHLGIGQRF
jgi:outer membrane protein insertion porin family